MARAKAATRRNVAKIQSTLYSHFFDVVYSGQKGCNHIIHTEKVMKMLNSSKIVSALKVQKTLSAAMGNEVTKQSVIHKAVVSMSEFDSFEQMMALTDRSTLIKESLWAERELDANEIIIHAGGLSAHLCLSDAAIRIYSHDGLSLIGTLYLPQELGTYMVLDDDIEYSHKNKSIEISAGGFKFFFMRKSPIIMNILGHDRDGNAIFNKSFSSSKEALESLDDALDIKKQMAMLVSTMDRLEWDDGDVIRDALKIGLTKEEVMQTVWTAICLHTKAFEDNKKPMCKTLGVVCYLYFKNHLHGRDRFSNRNIGNLIGELDLDPHALMLLRNMAKNAYDRFTLTHYNR
mgnify:CR=1 FL=1